MLKIESRNFVKNCRDKLVLTEDFLDLDIDPGMKVKYTNRLRRRYLSTVEGSKFYHSDRLHKGNVANSSSLIDSLSDSMVPFEDLCRVRPREKKKRKKKTRPRKTKSRKPSSQKAVSAINANPSVTSKISTGNLTAPIFNPVINLNR